VGQPVPLRQIVTKRPKAIAAGVGSGLAWLLVDRAEKLISPALRPLVLEILAFVAISSLSYAALPERQTRISRLAVVGASMLLLIWGVMQAAVDLALLNPLFPNALHVDATVVLVAAFIYMAGAARLYQLAATEATQKAAQTEVKSLSPRIGAGLPVVGWFKVRGGEQASDAAQIMLNKVVMALPVETRTATDAAWNLYAGQNLRNTSDQLSRLSDSTPNTMVIARLQNWIVAYVYGLALAHGLAILVADESAYRQCREDWLAAHTKAWEQLEELLLAEAFAETREWMKSHAIPHHLGKSLKKQHA
jgi:hypothetical protein